MQSSMTLKCWGVRGSIPSPSELTVRHGGNTPCVSIEFGTHTTLILDAGSGIRPLGKYLVSHGSDIFVFLTHFHSDHIQGFPFFIPLYQKGRTIHLLPCPVDGNGWSLLDMIDGFHFPLRIEQIPSNVVQSLSEALALLGERGIAVSQIPTNHPGGAYGFRIEHAGRSVVFIPDNEIDPPYARTTEYEDLVRFCRGADILIHDSQYVDADIPAKHGWGHSTINQTCRLGLDAGVAHLLLFHHDPERTDDDLDHIETEMREWFGERGATAQCTVAYEGLTLEL